jgi:hypothetical protein
MRDVEKRWSKEDATLGRLRGIGRAVVWADCTHSSWPTADTLQFENFIWAGSCPVTEFLKMCTYFYCFYTFQHKIAPPRGLSFLHVLMNTS